MFYDQRFQSYPNKIYNFSVHFLHLGGVLVVLLAAAVLVTIDGGREEHREQVNKVEKVNTGKKGGVTQEPLVRI